MSLAFNPFTSNFDLVFRDRENFSYTKISESDRITIPDGQQMLVRDLVDVEGLLIVLGEAFLLRDDFDQENFSYEVVSQGISVYQNQQMIVHDLLDIQDNVHLDGTISLIQDDSPNIDSLLIDNFSYEVVAATVSIPLNQQMYVDDLYIAGEDVLGLTNLNGTLVLGYPFDDSTPPEVIPDGQGYRVRQNKSCLIYDLIDIQGLLRLEGLMVMMRQELLYGA